MSWATADETSTAHPETKVNVDYPWRANWQSRFSVHTLGLVLAVALPFEVVLEVLARLGMIQRHLRNDDMHVFKV